MDRLLEMGAKGIQKDWRHEEPRSWCPNMLDVSPIFGLAGRVKKYALNLLKPSLQGLGASWLPSTPAKTTFPGSINPGLAICN